MITMINALFTSLVTVTALGIASYGQYPLYSEDYANMNGEFNHGRKCRR